MSESHAPTPFKFLLALGVRLLEGEPTTRPLWIRWGFAIAVTLLALWVRMLMGSPDSGVRFATLTLAVVLSALFGGFSSGLLSTVLAVFLAILFFNAPIGQLPIADHTEGIWLLVTFVFTMLVLLGAIWLMQLRNRRLREMTRRLTESQTMLRNTFEHAAAGISHVSLQGQLLQANQTFCDLVGYSQDELRNLSFQDITVPEDLSLDLALLAETLAGQRNQYAIEKRYRRKDGSTVWAQLTVALIRDAQGAPDYFISVVQDISIAKATEEALRTGERRMQQAQSVADFITWEADIATQKFRAFGSTSRGLNLPRTAFDQSEVYSRTHPDDHQRMRAEWESAIKDKAHFIGQYRGHPTQKFAWFLVQANFERDDAGKAIRAYGVTQDISKRKLAELEIQRLNASLEQRIQERTKELKVANAELQSYSYAVAHDLRSPLRIINGFAQALEEDNPQLTESSQNHIQRIKSSSRRMGELIDGLLKLAQYNRSEVQRQDISISAMATRVLSELAHDHPERQVTWTVEPNLHTQADPALVDALLHNLLHNAWKYTGQKPSAEIRVYREASQNGAPCYCVSDNGAGFDMAHANKLFQPFQRLHMPHEFEGLGVGLATARRIVQKHGGELRADASPGRGATFSFTLSGNG